MKLKRFVHHIAISVNPTKYKQVVEKTFPQTLGLYFFVWAIALVLLLIAGLFELNSFLAVGEKLVHGVPVSSPSYILVPGMVFLIGLLIFIVSHSITLISALIIKVTIKKALSFRDAWVLCLHAVLVPVLLFTIFLPFAKTFWSFIIMFFFYAIFVTIGTSLVAGKQFKSVSSHDEETTLK